MPSAKRIVSKLVFTLVSHGRILNNNSGPAFDPCGTPHLIVSIFDKESVFTNKLLAI